MKLRVIRSVMFLEYGGGFFTPGYSGWKDCKLIRILHWLIECAVYLTKPHGDNKEAIYWDYKTQYVEDIQDEYSAFL